MSETPSSDPLVEAFGELPPPSARELNIENFIKSNVSRGRRIALVTSGGTAAPLEKTGVRFIDNFSTGRRGAAIAQVLLEQVNPSYAVIFLARKGCPTPCLRHVYDLLENDINRRLRFPEDTRGFSPYITVDLDRYLKDDIRARQKAEQNDQLLIPTFTTVKEYLHDLRTISVLLQRHARRKALIMLAAAVSDYYIPPSKLPHHKIQSGQSSLHLELTPTPKCLELLKKEWAPFAFIVSFKLETDENILVEKAKEAIKKYGVDAVLANELASRYHRVKVVTSSGVKGFETSEGRSNLDETYMKHIVGMHSQYTSK